LLILCTIWDTKEGRESRIAGNKAETLEAIVDDLALRPVSYPVVESPVNVRVADPTGTPVTVRWDPAPDVNVEYYAVYRRQADEPAGACRGIGEVRAHIHRFEDRQLPGPGVYRYAVRALDFMARESALVETDAVSVR